MPSKTILKIFDDCLGFFVAQPNNAGEIWGIFQEEKKAMRELGAKETKITFGKE